MQYEREYLDGTGVGSGAGRPGAHVYATSVATCDFEHDTIARSPVTSIWRGIGGGRNGDLLYVAAAWRTLMRSASPSEWYLSLDFTPGCCSDQNSGKKARNRMLKVLKTEKSDGRILF